jgi:hypothetical protein
MVAHHGVEHAVRRGLVDEAVTSGVDHHEPPGQERLVVPVEVDVQQPKTVVVADELRADLGAEIDGVAAGAVGADVPRPLGGGGGRVVAGELLRAVAEPAGGDHDRASGDLVSA